MTAKLINEKTGAEVKTGEIVTTFRGEQARLAGFTSPRHVGSTGKVYILFDGQEMSAEFYPSVIGCKIVEG